MLAGPLKLDSDMFYVHLSKRLTVMIALQQRQEQLGRVAAPGTAAGIAGAGAAPATVTGPASTIRLLRQASPGVIGGRASVLASPAPLTGPRPRALVAGQSPLPGGNGDAYDTLQHLAASIGEVDLDGLLARSVDALGSGKHLDFENVRPHLEGIRAPKLRSETAEWCAHQLALSSAQVDLLTVAHSAAKAWLAEVNAPAIAVAVPPPHPGGARVRAGAASLP